MLTIIWLNCQTYGLHSILSRCAHLETLKIGPAAYFLCLTDFSLVGEYLRSLGQNLMELDLGPISNFENFTGALGSLETLNHLRKLSMPWETMAQNFAANMKDAAVSAGDHPPVLKLVDQLPSSLEYLSVYVDPIDLKPWQLLQLVQSDRLSRLKSVRVTHGGKYVEYDQIAFRQDVLGLGWDARRYTEQGWNPFDIPFRYEWMILEKRRA